MMETTLLPKFKNELILKHENAITGDIISKLNKAFYKSVIDTKKFAEEFRGKNCYDSALNVWNFLKYNVKYKKDPEGKQIIKYPSALFALKDTEGGDCKSFSLFASSILYNLGCKNIRLRYVSFKDDRIPTHVYLVFSYNGKDIPVDAVIDYFDHENKFKFKKDYKMNVYELSGVEELKEIQHLQNLWKSAPNKSFCKHLLWKELQEKKGIKLEAAILTERQKNFYHKKLMHQILWHRKHNYINLCYQLKLKELDNLLKNKVVGYLAGTGDAIDGRILNNNSVNGIGKLHFRLKDISTNNIKKEFKKYGLAVNRNAFLALVDMNAFNLAARLKESNIEKVNDVWRKLGGDTDKLRAAIKTGYNKGLQSNKHTDKIQGTELVDVRAINGIGVVHVAAAAIIAAAAPILAALASVISKGKNQKLNSDDVPMVDASGSPIMEEGAPILEVLKRNGVDMGEAAFKIYKILKKKPNGDVSPELNDDVMIADKEGFSFGGKKLLLIGGAALAAFLIIKPSHK